MEIRYLLCVPVATNFWEASACLMNALPALSVMLSIAPSVPPMGMTYGIVPMTLLLQQHLVIS